MVKHKNTRKTEKVKDENLRQRDTLRGERIKRKKYETNVHGARFDGFQ